MTHISVSKVVALAALTPLALTAACGGVKGASSSDTGPVVLGTSLSMTGPLGQFGGNLKTGYQQQVDEVNKAGGLDVGGHKRKVVLKVLDNRSDPNTSTQQVRELVLKDHAVAILGACTPPVVLPEALAAEQQKVPFVSSCNPVLAFQGGNKSGWNYAWDLFFDERNQASTVAKGLGAVKSNQKVAIFTDTEPDGVAERGLYKAAAKAAGLEVVGDYSFPVGTSDFSTFINDAKSKNAQLVAGQMIPPDGIALWKQMKSLSFKPVAAFVAKASAGKAWIDALGPVAEGTLSDDFWSPTTGKANSKELDQTLGKKYPNNLADLNIAVLAYTVSAIVTDAITAAHSTDPAKVNAAIAKTDKDYPLGHITFGKEHTAATPYLLTQWQNGSSVVVIPKTPGASLESPIKGLQ